MLLLSANSTIGHKAAQSFWSLRTMVRNTWLIERLARLVAPSVCGWNMVDIRSLVPISRCSSFQNLEVNFESLSDTIESGTPCSLIISFRKSHATTLEVTRVVVGIKCTCDV